MTCSMIPSRRGGELTRERESRCRASLRARVEALPAPAAAVTAGGPRASRGRLGGTALQRPTGQCSTVMSSMGKSAGLPVARRASMPAVAAAIRQSAW
jgi:hypothetical protein